MATKVYVESWGQAATGGQRATLAVQYSDKLTRVEIQLSPPLHDREPTIDILRRDLQGLLAALEEWDALHTQIEPKT
jgi:hypothetical protein